MPPGHSEKKFLFTPSNFRCLQKPKLPFETLGIQHSSSCPCLSFSSNDVNDTGA